MGILKKRNLGNSNLANLICAEIRQLKIMRGLSLMGTIEKESYKMLEKLGIESAFAKKESHSEGLSKV